MSLRSPAGVLFSLSMMLCACSGNTTDAAPSTTSSPQSEGIIGNRSFLLWEDSPSGDLAAIYFRAHGGGAAGWVARDIWIGPPGEWSEGEHTYIPNMNPRRWGFLCEVSFDWESDRQLSVRYGIVADYLSGGGSLRSGLLATPEEIAGVSVAYEYDPSRC